MNPQMFAEGEEVTAVVRDRRKRGGVTYSGVVVKGRTFADLHLSVGGRIVSLPWKKIVRFV